MTELKRLREEINNIISPACNAIASSALDAGTPIETCLAYKNTVIDQILSLKVYTGKSGEVYTLKDLIEKGVMPAENQSLPEGIFDYKQHERILREAGFIKVESRE